MNMSYCRFQNTVEALRDCLLAILEEDSPLSEEETLAKKRLIHLCKEIISATELI